MNAKHLTSADVQQAAEQARRDTEAAAVALAVSRARMEYTLAVAMQRDALPQPAKGNLARR